MSEFSIKVTIAGRTYPLTVKRDEEEAVRKAAKEINESVKVFQDNYAVKDKQDLLAMIALQVASELISKTESSDEKLMIRELKTLDEQLSELI